MDRNKFQAIILGNKRINIKIVFEVGDSSIRPEGEVKYLGIILDKRSSMSKHNNYSCLKTERTAKALNAIMSNIDRPSESKCRTFDHNVFT